MSDPCDETRALALRWFDEVWNRRRDETVDELMAPDAVARLEGIGRAGREEFKKARRSLLDAMSDLHVEVRDVVVEGGSAVVRWRLTGTHDGDGFGFAPSGREVDVPGLTWLRIDGGRIIGGCDCWNMGGMIADLRTATVHHVRRKHGLTERQAEVALLMARRRTYKEIARSLGIRPNTARRHCQDVLRRLGVHRRQEVGRILGPPHVPA